MVAIIDDHDDGDERHAAEPQSQVADLNLPFSDSRSKTQTSEWGLSCTKVFSLATPKGSSSVIDD